jgi:hypothetical protein
MSSDGWKELNANKLPDKKMKLHLFGEQVVQVPNPRFG